MPFIKNQKTQTSRTRGKPRRDEREGYLLSNTFSIPRLLIHCVCVSGRACSLEETGLAITIGVDLGVEAVEQGGLVVAAVAAGAVGVGNTDARVGAAVVVSVDSGIKLAVVPVAEERNVP